MTIVLKNLTQYAFRLQLDDGTVILAHYYLDTNTWEFDKDINYTGENSVSVKLTEKQRQDVMELIKDDIHGHIKEICK